ncbi:MAG: dihydrofolate reductase [Candidatus Levybacteria bacterium]|nr:dihydrofolate reductase [Candidatus Levybacteria bacterium]
MNNPKISIVVAVGENREIGKENDLIWDIPEDRKRFRDITRGHVVIWGRKTFESVLGYIGKAPPGRTNIIVTRDKNYKYEECIVAHSLEEALRVAREKESEEIFIGGGGQIYKTVIPQVDRLYLTIVHGKFDSDTFFPDYLGFKNVIEPEEEHESNGYKYTWVTLEK